MKILSATKRIACLVALAIVLFSPGAGIAAYPEKVIRFVIGFSAGGSTDVIARIIARRMSEILGQPIIIENRPGVDSLIATKLVADAVPDGYTLLVASGSHSINVSLYTDPKVDPVKHFSPVGLIGDAANFLVVTPSLNANTVPDLVALAKKDPGKLNFASSASTTFLATELFNSMAGIKATSIPYKGSGQAVPALLSGEVDYAITSIVTMLSHVKSGKARALAVTGATRSPLAPNVPTVTEKGVPGYTSSTWYGMLAPAGTPAEAVQVLSAALRKTMQEQAVKTLLEAQGVEPMPNSPEEFTDYIRNDVVKWAKVVKNSGAQPK